MKYIIDVPEDRVHGDILCAMGIMEDSLDHYIPTGIKAVPYDESDTAEQAWKIAQDILKDPGKDGMLNGELNDCFGTDDIYLIGAMSYAEVKAKYEAWQEKKDKIKVGDEIIHEEYGKCVILEKEGSLFCAIDEDGVLYHIHKDYIIRKTGRHFSEVAELLEKMRE